MQLCKYIYEVAFTEPFEGNINGKQVKSKVITVEGHTFIGTGSGKAIWVKVKSKNREFRFSLPISQMFNVKKIDFKGKNHIVFEMTKGMHRSATFGKKKQDGTPIFKPSPKCWNCGNYTSKRSSGGYQQGTYVQESTSGSQRI